MIETARQFSTGAEGGNFVAFIGETTGSSPFACQPWSFHHLPTLQEPGKYWNYSKLLRGAVSPPRGVSANPAKEALLVQLQLQWGGITTSRRYFAIGMFVARLSLDLVCRILCENILVERDANERDAITDIKGETRGSLRNPEETGAAAGAKIRWRQLLPRRKNFLEDRFGGFPFRPLRPTAPRTREESLARDGFNDFWGLLGMAPFLRMGEGGRGVRGIFKPLLSVGTLFSGTLVVALSPQLLPR